MERITWLHRRWSRVGSSDQHWTRIQAGHSRARYSPSHLCISKRSVCDHGYSLRTRPAADRTTDLARGSSHALPTGGDPLGWSAHPCQSRPSRRAQRDHDHRFPASLAPVPAAWAALARDSDSARVQLSSQRVDELRLLLSTDQRSRVVLGRSSRSHTGSEWRRTSIPTLGGAASVAVVM